MLDKLEKMFNDKFTSESNFWNIECDSAFNYRFYFTNKNPDNLSQASSNKKNNFLDHFKK